jgi:hypothetical protein
MKNNYIDLIYLQFTKVEHFTSVSNIAKEKRIGNTPFDHITYFFSKAYYQESYIIIIIE